MKHIGKLKYCLYEAALLWTACGFLIMGIKKESLFRIALSFAWFFLFRVFATLVKDYENTSN